MDFDAWHHWLLLRPLFVFLLAGPFVEFAALVVKLESTHRLSHVER
jgi:hypothetical protein